MRCSAHDTKTARPGLTLECTHAPRLGQPRDPDGGNVTKQLKVKTRALPSGPAHPKQVDATPGTIASLLESSEPGTVLVLADGTYGELLVPNDGSAEDPIVIGPKNKGGAIVEGDLRLDARAYVQIEGLTIHGKIKLNDAHDLLVRACTIETAGDGIVAFGTGATDVAILDNTIRGATQWAESSLGVNGDNIGEGIALTGPGNVIAFNRVSGFRDCISLLEGDEAVNQRSVDIYGNDLTVCADDAIEADFSMGNVRVYHNRITDSFMGISSQPSLGGPAYFVRNVMHNIVFQGFKLQRGSTGDVGLHNTVIKSGDALSVNTETPIAHAFFRNNLFIGGPGGIYNGYDSGDGKVIYLPTADATCSFDYDGVGTTASVLGGTLGDVKFTSLTALRAGTTERHAVKVSLADFASAPDYPGAPFAPYATPDFELKASGAAIDVGVLLANINDGHAGDAPDLGALELGAKGPMYGPGGSLPGGGAGGGDGSSGGESNGGESNGANGKDASAGGDVGAGDGGVGPNGHPSNGSAKGGCACGVSQDGTGLPTSLLLALWLLRRSRRSATA